MNKPVKTQDVALPFSNGELRAVTWKKGRRVVVGVPELGLHCYGTSEREVVFRLFTALLKYYRQLKSHKQKLNAKGVNDLQLLRQWVEGIENRLTARQETAEIVSLPV